jgi:outer membrane biosynthesis protein TonB
VVPPAPRGLILPPADRPGKVRGKEVEVWVFVTAGGAVVADSTRLSPSSGDSRFDERLKKQAAQWMFQPARREGRAVAEWFRYVLTL